MYKYDNQRPLICGEFNDWRPSRMMRIDEYTRALDKTAGHTDLMTKLKEDGKISETALKQLDEMDEE